MVQVLTLAAVKTAAAAAFTARKLSAQAKRRFDRRCEYEVGDCKCAIGAAFNAETFAVIRDRSLNTQNTVNSLIRKGVIDVALGEREAVIAIQSAHDDWASAAGSTYKYTERQVRNKREAFKKLIGL